MRRAAILISSLTVLLLASACGGSDSPSEAEGGSASVAAPGATQQTPATQSTAAPELAGESFESVNDLKSALGERGVKCGSDEVMKSEGYKEALACGGSIWLTVYDDDEQKSKRLAHYKEQNARLVEGNNWLVIAPQGQLDKLTS